MASVKESDLIGIGKKFQMDTESGERIVVVIHDDGRRELYRYDQKHHQSYCLATLSDDESRQLAGIVGGLAYKPKALETIEVALNDLVIEWYKVEEGANAGGKSIGELGLRQNVGVAVIAAIAGGETLINPGPDFVITAGITLVAAGTRENITRLKHILRKA